MLLSNFATDPSLSLARRGFSPGTPVFPSAQKPSFANSNSTRNQVDEADHNHYLFCFYTYWRPNYGHAQTATFAMMKQAWNQANLAFYNKLTTAKMRISCHFLPIESGRYKKIPRVEKLCHLCNRSEIGDEFHYLLKNTHSSLSHIKGIFLESPHSINSNFTNMSCKALFLYTMSMCDKNIINLSASCIENILNCYKSEIYWELNFLTIRVA